MLAKGCRFWKKVARHLKLGLEKILQPGRWLRAAAVQPPISNGYYATPKGKTWRKMLWRSTILKAPRNYDSERQSNFFLACWKYLKNKITWNAWTRSQLNRQQVWSLQFGCVPKKKTEQVLRSITGEHEGSYIFPIKNFYSSVNFCFFIFISSINTYFIFCILENWTFQKYYQFFKQQSHEKNKRSIW